MSGLTLPPEDEALLDAMRKTPPPNWPVTLDATQLADLVTLKIDGPAIIFIRVAPEKMTDDYVASIIDALNLAMSAVRGMGVRFLVVPKDIDLAVVGEAQLEKLGLMRIPEPAP